MITVAIFQLSAFWLHFRYAANTIEKMKQGNKKKWAIPFISLCFTASFELMSFLCLISGKGLREGRRRSVSQNVLGIHSPTMAVQLTVMLLALFPSWTTENIHQGLTGKWAKAFILHMKEIYHFSNPSSSEYCFRKSISADDELIGKEKIKCPSSLLGFSWCCHYAALNVVIVPHVQHWCWASKLGLKGRIDSSPHQSQAKRRWMKRPSLSCE